jgi:hypothetical protein
MDGHERRVECATYTHARRHPMVLGKIGDWTPPFQLTMPQIGVIVGAVLLETWLWRYWGAHLPAPLAITLFVTVPIILAWVVRHARVEGRSLIRFAGGAVAYMLRPRSGRAGGRSSRPAPPSALHRYRILVQEATPK